MRFSLPLLATLLVLTSCCSPGRGPIPNLAVVEPGSIWRGGQPTIEGWRQLKALGVTNVIKLNTESEGSDAEAKRLGMRVVYVPITTWQQTFGPVSPQLRIGVTNIVPHTFIHCEFGKNRTGTEIILYRIQHGWTKERAVKEANSLGWGSSLPALKEFVEDLR